ncbi:MAG TPA: Pls/PosA family non-ribosomal peptide synthetase, partial [Pirellulales bacterium]|nr:Pls/PosA family non-ribosomal peptide synthetase [Pirellulales bacterium]
SLPGDLLHQFFETQADHQPDQVALECGGERLTYAQLDRAANRLAHWFRSQGVGRGSLVALWLPRSVDAYVALLAVLKAGAGYVPLDPDYPLERIEFVLADSGAAVLVTHSSLVGEDRQPGPVVLRVDRSRAALARFLDERLPRDRFQARSDDLCYVIYTSGSTGRPKGVEIEHRSACHLVRAEAELFKISASDRVFQGFSLAFDASVEELWLAWFAGATLVAGTKEMIHAGPALATLLTDAGVTVLSCVPTLLAMMDDDVPSMRLLILGGEECSAALVRRWCRPGRRMVNTYGPTEATVIATFADCDPARPVTIGRPLPNYYVYVVDDDLQAVASGQPGELLIGGIGLARGYLGRPDLTREKFIAHPLADSPACTRLYRTGDLVRFNDDGDLEFLGRIDGQIKLRGFRIEVGEIEAVLRETEGVRAAAVTVTKDAAGGQQLAAYLVVDPQTNVDERAVVSRLRSRLPAYMVPATIDRLDNLPTLASGKLDRKRLPAPRARQVAERDYVPPKNPIEQELAEAWQSVFGVERASTRDDFFLDLGGHSLLAARLVSRLRNEPTFAAISMLDVYEHPTIETLALKFADATPSSAGDPSPVVQEGQPHREEAQPSNRLSYALCSLGQFLSLYLVLGFFSLQWLGPYLTYTWMIDNEYPLNEALVGALGSLLVVYPIMLLAAIATKWIVIGRYKPGDYPLWGWFFFRWWFVKAITSSIPIDYLAGTPLLSAFYRLMGAKIGANVHLATDNGQAYDLLEIGDDSSIGEESSLAGCTVEHGVLRIGPIKIGRRVFVGARSVVREHAVIDDGAKLEDLSLLPRGDVIPQGEHWQGSPARRVGQAVHEDALVRPSLARRFGFGLLHALGVMLVPLFVMAAIFPGMIVMNRLNYWDDYYWYLVVSPAVALSFVVFLCLEIAAFKWLLLGRVKAGTYPLYSSFYLRKWFVSQLLELSLDVVGPLYSTIYLQPWYRLLGAKLGRRAEISTASFISPDLLAIDDEGFIADSVSLGAARVEDGRMTVAATRVGKRSFIGNSALLPPGAQIGDHCLVGCLSTPPAGGAVDDGTSWLGSPGFNLPRRQESTAFSEETTFSPTRALWFKRAAIEACRVLLPSSCFLAITSVLLSVVLLIHEEMAVWELLALFPVLYAAAGIVAVFVTIAVKWLLMGRYRPCERPLWSTFVWKTELVAAMHEHLADLFLIGKLSGTPFVCWFFRLLGAKIGQRVYLDTTDITEFDLVDIGDEATINRDVTLQTHLFEDRVMKMSHVRIGRRASVGSMSLVLYDTEMGERSALGELSLLMKGETLPAGTSWQGIPARLERPE